VRFRAPPTDTVPPSVLWIDERAPEGGDGSSEHPLRVLPNPLETPTAIHLRSGLYRGPIRVAPGTSVEGHGTAVIFVEGRGNVAELTGGSLKNVSLQGGDVGATIEGPVTLDAVHFSGHRKWALECRGASLQGADLDLEGALASSSGLSANGCTLALDRLRVRGPFRRAVELRDGTAQLRRLDIEGASTGVHALLGSTTITQASIRGGRGPAVFLGGGRNRIESLEVVGHEYALQLGQNTTIDVDGFTSRGAQLAGISAVKAEGVLRRLDIERSGNGGALALLDSRLLVEDGLVAKAAALGIFVRHGSCRINRFVVDGVRGEPESGGGVSQGDALHVRDAEVSADEFVARDVQGSAVFAGASANVTLGRLVSERSGYGAIVAERRAHVTAREVVSTAAPISSIAALEEADVRLERLVVPSGPGVPIWADCVGETRVDVRELVTNLAQPPSRCVSVIRHVPSRGPPETHE
jgi:hypothetical protein